MTDEKHHPTRHQDLNGSEQPSEKFSLKEEVTRWRIPNRQPKDGDYFSREDLAKLQQEKQRVSDNEFRYHSIKDDLIRQRKETEKEEKAQEKSVTSILDNILTSGYEEHYDLEHLNPIQSYDQFSSKEETEEEKSSVNENISTQNVTDHQLASDKYYVKEIEPVLSNSASEDMSSMVEDITDKDMVQVEPTTSSTISRDEMMTDSEGNNEAFETSSISDQVEVLEGDDMNEDVSESRIASMEDQSMSNMDYGMPLDEFQNEDNLTDSHYSSQEYDQEQDQTMDFSEALYFGNNQEDELTNLRNTREDSFINNQPPSSDTEPKPSEMSEQPREDLKESLRKQWNSYQLKGRNFKEKFNPKSSFIGALKNVRYKIQKDTTDEDSQLHLENAHRPNDYYVRWKEELTTEDTVMANQEGVDGTTQIYDVDEFKEFTDKESTPPQRISREWLRKNREQQIKNYPKGSVIDHLTKDASEIIPEQYHTDPIITDAVLDDMGGYDNVHVTDTMEADAIQPQTDTTHDDANFLSGAAWITFGMVFSRIIGALYVIPWATWFGDHWIKANGLYGAGYDPYVFFLALATAGIPSAIAKQISYNHSLGKYKRANMLFKYSVYIMIASGVLSGCALYIMAPFLAENTAIVDKAAATQVIQSLSPALVILPAMSIIRGYFQGNSLMKPIAISDVIEQLVRVIYLLAATYAIMQVLNGNVTQAVMHSTFAAFVGAVASLIYLLIVFVRHRKLSQALVLEDPEDPQITFASSAKTIIKDSIPFIILGSGIIIAKLINTYTFGHILKQTSILMLSEIEEMYGVLNLDVDKLIMIIVSLAIALSSSFLPALTRVYARNDKVGTSTMITQIIIVFCFVMLPSAFGMAAISRNIYLLFYPNGSVLGPEILFTAAFSSIILGLFTVLSSILQSMSFRAASVKFLVVGLLFKLILQYPLVSFFQAHGAIISTSLGLGLTCVFMWIKINREVQMDNHGIVNDLIRIIIPTILMGISAMMWAKVLNSMLPHAGRLGHLGIIFLVIVLSVIVYGGLMGIQGMLSIIIGDRFSELQNKLRIKR